jgi:hypothetical protein
MEDDVAHSSAQGAPKRVNHHHLHVPGYELKHFTNLSCGFVPFFHRKTGILMRLAVIWVAHTPQLLGQYTLAGFESP